MLIIRFILSLIAIAMIVVGVVTMVSPIPFGIILIVSGLALLVLANPKARPFLRWLRRKLPFLDHWLDEAEPRSSGRIRDVLRETDPEEQGEEDATPEKTA